MRRGVNSVSPGDSRVGRIFFQKFKAFPLLLYFSDDIFSEWKSSIWVVLEYLLAMFLEYLLVCIL